MSVKCEICSKVLTDWSGNVMIPNDSMDGIIDDLQVWCKSCTVKLDHKGPGRVYHNLWELNWIKQDQEKILRESGYAEKFSGTVKAKVQGIINAAKQN